MALYLKTTVKARVRYDFLNFCASSWDVCCRFIVCLIYLEVLPLNLACFVGCAKRCELFLFSLAVLLRSMSPTLAITDLRPTQTTGLILA